MRTKSLHIHVTEDELNLIREAARRAGKTASQFGADLVLGTVRGQRKKQPEVLDAVENFRRLFCEAMELNLAGKLTAARMKGLAERRSCDL